MQDITHSVRFEPTGRVLDVMAGATLIEAAGQAGIIIDTPCGGGGVCGKCRVRIPGGPLPGDAEKNAFSTEELAEGWRLACRQHIQADTTVYVPETSVFGGTHQILTTHDTNTEADLQPEIVQARVAMERPSLTDGRPDLLRLERALQDRGVAALTASPWVLNRLTRTLQEKGYSGAAIFRQNRLLDFCTEAGPAGAPSYGLAFDIGTTTLVGVLIDLRNGRECGIVSAMNPQTAFGDDVISRIAHALQGPREQGELRHAVAGTVAEMARDLCRQAGIAAEEVHLAAFSGNTTMQHLLCGIDPSPLSRVPFVPVMGRGMEIPASEFGLDIHPDAQAYVFPVIGGFVGGDTVSGLLATGLAEPDGARLFIDVGTNGEIVLAHGENLWAASTAAGPAFEGARISCGMRAAAGAIEKVVIDTDLHLGVIGGVAPVGLCGSGLIDLCGQLRKAGLLSCDGRLSGREDLPGDIPPALADRFVRDESGAPAFLLHAGAGGRPLSLTQRDVRELQLAAGAIRAGITILLKEAGLPLEEVRRVLLAGGFGSFIRRDNAQRIGLLPTGLPHDRILYVGNASLAGAKWAVLSGQAKARAEAIARQTRHVELSNDPDFAMEFAMAMYFPD